MPICAASGISGSVNMPLFRAALLVAAGITQAAGAERTLTVVSWGGAYEEAQSHALLAPFAAHAGIAVEALQYDGSIQAIADRSAAESWDVIDMTEVAAIGACRDGLIQPIEAELIVVPEASLQPDMDFIDGAFRECSIAQNLFASVIAFNALAFPGVKPGRVEDFFDLDTFPGKRAIQRSPDAILEWALIAEGVPTEQVYDLLSTDRGLSLAFRKLSTIRDHIVWWDVISDSVGLLADLSVAMATGFNGRFFHAANVDGIPVQIIWDGQQIGIEVWAVSGQSDLPQEAEAFIAFATGPDRMARLAEAIPYAPARSTGMQRVGMNQELWLNMRDHLPMAAGDSGGRLLIQDGEWYANTSELRTRRFEAWISGEGN